MTPPRDRCHCGKQKDVRAKECPGCHWKGSGVKQLPIAEHAPVEWDDPVRNWFEWIIERSRGEIS